MKQWQVKILMSACALVLTVAPASMALSQSILVWGAGNDSGNTQGVADYLAASGYFEMTTAVDANLVDIGTLLEYDAVLYFSNSSGDSQGAGDVLADYADTGRRLVLCTFSWANQGGNTLGGRIIADEISPLMVDGTSLYTDVTMASNDGSGFFTNVATVEGYYHDDVALSTGAVEHGTWSDGEPLLASKGNVVGVNLFPDDSFGFIGGDYQALFANALAFDVVATEDVTWGDVKAMYRNR
jgi:hypothetical protein